MAAPSSAPQAPTGILAYRVANTVQLVWDLPLSGPAPTSYIVSVTGAFTASFPVAGRSIGGAVGPGTYNLSVAAVNACGTGPATAVQTLVVP